jgi:hypothetical protein
MRVESVTLILPLPLAQDNSVGSSSSEQSDSSYNSRFDHGRKQSLEEQIDVLTNEDITYDEIHESCSNAGSLDNPFRDYSLNYKKELFGLPSNKLSFPVYMHHRVKFDEKAAGRTK